MSTTPNYGFEIPESDDSMAAINTYINPVFSKLVNRNDPTVVAAGQPLPQSGNYSLYDRVFRADAPNLTTAPNYSWPSNYLLTVKDPDWGWHWRPIQTTRSPWVPIPESAVL